MVAGLIVAATGVAPDHWMAHLLHYVHLSSSTGKRQMPGSFVASNVLLYLLSEDSVKAERAEVILRGGSLISVQVLNEVTHVCRRKARMSWAETHALLTTIRAFLPVCPVTVDTHDLGLVVAGRYGLSVYDAMLVGAALEADCDIFWSENMRDGLVVNECLTITNPFRTVPLAYQNSGKRGDGTHPPHTRRAPQNNGNPLGIPSTVFCHAIG